MITVYVTYETKQKKEVFQMGRHLIGSICSAAGKQHQTYSLLSETETGFEHTFIKYKYRTPSYASLMVKTRLQPLSPCSEH